MGLIYKSVSAAPRCAVVVLHGADESPDDYRDFAKDITRSIGGCFAALAQGGIEMKRKAYQSPEYRWFSLDDFPPRLIDRLPDDTEAQETLKTAFNRHAPLNGDIHHLVDKLCKRFNITAQNIALFGFSQGGTVALHSAYNDPKPLACVVAHSAPFLGSDAYKTQSPTLLIAGAKDKYFNTAASPFSLHRTADHLRGQSVKTNVTLVDGLGHDLNAVSKAESIRYIAAHLP